jgi:hypothetical protein
MSDEGPGAVAKRLLRDELDRKINRPDKHDIG